MKITTDSILIGSWVEVDGCTDILDVGTGTGIVAMMVAQKACEGSRITGIDIDGDSAEEAYENFAASPWPDRLRSEHCSFSEFATKTQPGSFDLIVSNPPFFDNSLKSPFARKSAARHSDTLPPEELISDSFKLLRENGRLAVILPVDRASVFILSALQKGFFLHRECRVRSEENGPVLREMIEVGKKPIKNVATLTLTLGGDEHKRQVAEYVY
ncbi:MAG: methyltransferase [Bacteroidales bacterium]|nr:methyltransferase [Bacteroidales bacterium]